MADFHNDSFLISKFIAKEVSHLPLRYLGAVHELN